MKYYIKAIRYYFVTNDKTNRVEFWSYTLFNLLFLICASELDSLFHITIFKNKYGYFYFIYSFITIIPSITIGIRRMHDVGKSGWFYLIPIYNLILSLKPSKNILSTN